jgi:acyl-CoA synthetase (NDP forming)
VTPNAVRYVAAVERVRADPGVDGVAALFVPQGLADASVVAEALASAIRPGDKPLIAA